MTGTPGDPSGYVTGSSGSDRGADSGSRAAKPAGTDGGSETPPQGSTRGRSSAQQAFGLLGAFVALSMVAGLLGAGIAVPMVGLAGLTAKEAVGRFEALPAEFTASPMAQQSQILASDGTVIATLYEENRTVVPLDQIAPIMQDAQVAIEDDRFYEHGGVDALGIARALYQTSQGEKQGASTITQQYVKQTRVYAALREEDTKAADAAQARGGISGVVRKLQEAKYSIALEEKLSKKQILEGYLNLVYYGAGAYGVEAASRRYFGVSAADLNLPQAAMIAGMAQRPGATDPFQHPDAAQARRDDVLERMRATGAISTQRMRAAMRAPIELNPTKGQASCPASKDPYFCDYVKAWLTEQPALGDTPAEREKRVYRGGLKIKTTYDMKLNEQIRKELDDRLPVGNSQHRGTAAAVVEPGTGHVIALAQNTDYATAGGTKFGDTSVNWTVDHRYGGSGGFQIGSTAKMFAVVAALEQGMSASSRIDAPADGTPYSVARLGGRDCGIGGASYAPSNAESDEHGNMSLQHATAMSVNTAFVELASRIGVCKERDVMARMGLKTAQGGMYGENAVAAIILGADNASPLNVATAYATLAAGGKRCDPVPVTDITAFDGKKYAVSNGNCKQTVDPQVAHRATRILQSVLTEGTGRAIGMPDERPAAGKTGTSDASKQTWFAGFTPQRAAAVWVGTPDSPKPMRGVYGATIAGPLWGEVMTLSSRGLPREQFRMQGTDNDQVEVPDVIGRSEGSAMRRLQEAGFTVEVASRKVRAPTIAWGRVADTSVSAGEQANKGDTITLYLSRGIPQSQMNNNGDNGGGDGGDGGGDNGGD